MFDNLTPAELRLLRYLGGKLLASQLTGDECETPVTFNEAERDALVALIATLNLDKGDTPDGNTN